MRGRVMTAPHTPTRFLDRHLGTTGADLDTVLTRIGARSLEDLAVRVVPATLPVLDLPQQPERPDAVVGGLIDNISQHSGSRCGYLFCQRVRRELYIVIADRGRTIYGNYIYAKRYEDIVGVDEAAALRIANEGYSTKNLPTAENRGYGLSRSRKMIVKGLGGAYFMLSGTAFYRQGAEGGYVVNVPEGDRWNGTIILLRLPLETPKGFEFYDYVE